ncbi:MAG TPA: hypothetical protein PKZ84_13450 [Anaerolineae bacterium]|nr:hypothetical protein [Anaerolineae bacterium]HQI87408.1 hypothetical protein [Anaerolineae bacterium]
MNLKPYVSLVYVETLADFEREVSPDRPVRLLLSHQTQGHSPLLVRVYTLTLAGFNAYHELVILADEVRIDLDPQGQQPWTAAGESIADQVATWRALVREHLEAHGYTVWPAMYALPKDYTALRGTFECTHWRKTGETWAVEAATPEPEATVCPTA